MSTIQSKSTSIQSSTGWDIKNLNNLLVEIGSEAIWMDKAYLSLHSPKLKDRIGYISPDEYKVGYKYLFGAELEASLCRQLCAILYHSEELPQSSATLEMLLRASIALEMTSITKKISKRLLEMFKNNPEKCALFLNSLPDITKQNPAVKSLFYDPVMHKYVDKFQHLRDVLEKIDDFLNLPLSGVIHLLTSSTFIVDSENSLIHIITKWAHKKEHLGTKEFEENMLALLDHIRPHDMHIWFLKHVLRKMKDSYSHYPEISRRLNTLIVHGLEGHCGGKERLLKKYSDKVIWKSSHVIYPNPDKFSLKLIFPYLQKKGNMKFSSSPVVIHGIEFIFFLQLKTEGEHSTLSSFVQCNSDYVPESLPLFLIISIYIIKSTDEKGWLLLVPPQQIRVQAKVPVFCGDIITPENWGAIKNLLPSDLLKLNFNCEFVQPTM